MFGRDKLADQGGQLLKSLATLKPDPQDLLLITTLFLKHGRGILPAHGGHLFHWAGGSVALLGPLLLTSAPWDVQLQPNRVRQGLLKGQFGGLAVLSRDKAGQNAFSAHTQKLGLSAQTNLLLCGLQVGLHDPKTCVKKNTKSEQN